MLNQKYSEASVEVLDILNHMNIKDVSKVSKKFITFLNENTSFNTRFYKVGDGISVSKLKCE